MLDYSTATNVQLAEQCRARGLAAYGNKEQLTARLVANDEQAPIPTEQEQPMAQIVAGPDTGQDSGDDLLNAVTRQTPAEPTPAPQPPLDPRDQELLDLRAEVLQMRAQQAAKPGAAPTAGDVATPGLIAAAANREQVHRVEFPMMSGMELSDGIHESFARQIVDIARAAGFTTRGPGHRVGWGEKDGQRTAVYEIYVRPAQ